MTFGTSLLGEVSTKNSLTLVHGTNTVDYKLFAGTITSSTGTETVISGASATDDIYNNFIIEIMSGRGKGQCKNIDDYVGSTTTITTTAWNTVPDSTSTYVIHRNSGMAAEQTQSEGDVTIKLKAGESAIDDFYNRTFIKILGGRGVNQIREVIDYVGSSHVVRMERTWDIVPDETSLYAIFGEGGLCPNQGAATTTTIILDGNQSTGAVAQHMCIEIYSGTGIGQTRKVVSIATDTLTITPAWTVQPAQNDRYAFYSGAAGEFEEVKDFAAFTVTGLADISNGEKVIGERESSIDSAGLNHTVRYVESSIAFPRTNIINPITAKYFRLKIIGMGTTVSAVVQTIFHSSKSGELSLSVEEEIDSNNSVTVVRSVMVGKNDNGEFKNVSIDANDNINITISDPLTAFGELLTAQLEPVTQISYIFGISARKTEQFLSHGTYLTVNVDGAGGVALVQSIYFPEADSFSTGAAGDYFTLESGAPADYYVWFNMNATNSDPAPGGTGLAVTISTGESPSTVAAAVQAVVDGNAAFSASVFGSIVTITNAATGIASSAHLDNMPTASGSAITWDKKNSAALITTGAGVGDYAVLRSRRALVYRNGQGSDIRFTAVYDTPVAGTVQFAGAANSTAGLYIGYNGVDFQISRRTTGQHEIRELTITSVASATVGTLLVTVDGMRHTVTLTDVSTAAIVAKQISDHDYRTGLYLTEQVGDKTIFMSERLDGTTGTHNFIFALGTATNISGTFAQVTSAELQTSTNVDQTSWNIDRMDGNGPSGQVLNPQTGNVFKISFQWLGYGSQLFSIENSTSGKFAPVHVLRYANLNTTPSLSQPSLQFSAYTASTSSTVPITLTTASAGLFVQGQIKRFDPIYTEGNLHAGLTGVDTLQIMFAIRNPRVFNGKGSQVELFLKSLTVTSTKSATNTKVISDIFLITGGTPSASLTYTYVDEEGSTAYTATPSYADSITLAGGVTIFRTAVTAEGAATIDLQNFELLVPKNETLYIAYSHLTPSTGDIDLSASITWLEDH